MTEPQFELYELVAWRRYLEVSQRKEQTEQRSTPGAFERSTPDALVATDQQFLDSLSRDQRHLFDTVVMVACDEARETWVRDHPKRTPNVADIRRQTISALLDAATEPDEAGYVYVPRGTADQWEYWQVPYTDTIALPTDSAYHERTDEQKQRQNQRRTLLVLLGLAGVCVIWFVVAWVHLDTRVPVSSLQDSAVLVNGVPSEGWPIQYVGFTDTQGQTHPGQVDSSSSYPLRICYGVETADESAIVPEHITVASLPPYPTRRYQVDPAATMGDIHVTLCDDPTFEGDWGQLSAVESSFTPKDIGTQYQVHGVDLVVQDLQIHGRDRDPTLPVHEVLMVVTTMHAETLVWQEILPVLLLPSGAHVSARNTVATDTGTTFSYRLPLPDQAMEVLWLVPDTPSPVGWQTTVSPPRSRAVMLHDDVVIEQIDAVLNRTETHVDVTLTLRNTQSQAIQLVADDITIRTASDMMIPTPNSVLFQRPLPPEEVVAAVLTLPVTNQSEVLLTFAQHTYRLRVMEHERR